MGNICISNPYIISIYLLWCFKINDMINSNLKKSGGRSYLITWFHMIIDLSTERFLIAKSLKRMISERFPNDLSSQRFLARTTVTRPFAACFSLKALDFWKSDPWIISKSGKHQTIQFADVFFLNLENNWEKIELEKSTSHWIFQGFQNFNKKNESLWIIESTNDQSVHSSKK